jgi:hypothetical protein
MYHVFKLGTLVKDFLLVLINLNRRCSVMFEAIRQEGGMRKGGK